MSKWILEVPEDMKRGSKPKPDRDTYTPGRNALHDRRVEKSVVHKEKRVLGRRERARLKKHTL